MALALILLLILLAFIGLAIVWRFVQRRRGNVKVTAQSTMLGIAISLALVVVLVVAGLFTRPVRHQPFTAAAPSPQVLLSPEAPIWTEGVEEELQPDVYPSLQATATALGNRLGKELGDVTTQTEGPMRLHITGIPRPQENMAGPR